MRKSVLHFFFLPLMSLFSFDVWYWKPQNELDTVPVPVCWERGVSWFISLLRACFLVLSILEDFETFDKFSFIDAALFRSSISFMSSGSLFQETGQFRHVFQFSFIALFMHTWLLLSCVIAVFPSLAVGVFWSLQLSSAKLYLQCCAAALQSFLVLWNWPWLVSTALCNLPSEGVSDCVDNFKKLFYFIFFLLIFLFVFFNLFYFWLCVHLCACACECGSL